MRFIRLLKNNWMITGITIIWLACVMVLATQRYLLSRPVAANDTTNGILYPATFEESSWGYVDGLGACVIPVRYAYTGDFINGRAIVEFAAYPVISSRSNLPSLLGSVMGLRGIINPSGKLMTGFSIFVIGDESEGLYQAVKVRDCFAMGFTNGLIGYVDGDGQWIIPPRFLYAGTFKGGIAYARDPSGREGCIDKSGNWISPMGFRSYPSGLDGVILIHTSIGYADGEDWLMDRSGSLILLPRGLTKIGMFSEGIALAEYERHKDGKVFERGVGGLTPTGEWAFQLKDAMIPDTYPETIFKDGLAALYFNKKYGYVDARGQWIIPPSLDIAENFSEGFALAYSMDGERGYIDTTGAMVIKKPPDITGGMDPFCNTLARVGILQDGTGSYTTCFDRYMNHNGEFIWRR